MSTKDKFDLKKQVAENSTKIEQLETRLLQSLENYNDLINTVKEQTKLIEDLHNNLRVLAIFIKENELTEKFSDFLKEKKADEVTEEAVEE